MVSCKKYIDIWIHLKSHRDIDKHGYGWQYIQLPDAIMSDMRCKAAQAAWILLVAIAL